MKAIIILAALLAFVSADDWKPKTKDELDTIRDECLKENKVPTDLADKIMKYQYEDEESVRCYIKCSAYKNGVWNAEKGYDIDRFYDQVTQKEGVVTNKDDLRKCMDDKHSDEDECKWAFRNFKCMIDNKYISKKA